MKRIVLGVLIVLCLSVGLVGVAAADHAPEHEQDRTVVDEETSDAEAAHASSSSDGTMQFQSTDASNVEVAITADSAGPTYASNDTIEVFGGVLNTSGEFASPMAGEDMTIRITAPDGSETTFTPTTDGNGSVAVTYDLTSRPNGQYVIEAVHNDTGSTASLHKRAGISLEETTNGATEYIKEETTFAFLARDGLYPKAGLEVNLSVTHNGSTVKTKTATTDRDGFVNVSFTPNETGYYDVDAQATTADRTLYASESVQVSDLNLRSSFYELDEVTEGVNSTFYGQIVTEGGQVSNTDLVIELNSTTTSSPDVNLTTTTNERGFFAEDYQVPTGVENLQVNVRTADGRPVAASFWIDNIDVEPAPTNDDGGGNPPPETFVDLSVGVDDYGTGVDDWRSSTVPGGEVTVNIEARENDTAIANQPVNVSVRHGSSGAPIFSGTAVTNGSGVIQESFKIPDKTPDNTDVYGTAVLEYKNETYTERFWIGVERYTLDFDSDGGQVTFNATDRRTGGPAEGIQVHYDEQHVNDRSGSYATGRILTDGSGNAADSFDIPGNAGFLAHNNYVTRYDSTNLYRGVTIDHPGELTIVNESVAPGQTVALNLTTNAPAQGMAFTRIDFPVNTLATDISSGEPAMITIPSYAEPGEWLSFTVWAEDANGQLYEDTQWVQVEAEPVTVSGQLEYNDGSPAANDTVVVWTGQGWERTQTTADGNFSLQIPEYPGSGDYDLQYYQTSNVTEFTEGSFPRDGNVDTVALKNLDGISEDRDYGTLTLPAGQNINVTVEDAGGNTVKNATISYRHENAAEEASGGFEIRSNEAGQADLWVDSPDAQRLGAEMAGNVSVIVDPPTDERFVQQTYYENFTVDGERDLTFVLDTYQETTATFAVDTENPTANESVTFNASESFGATEIQTYSWDFGDGNTVETSDPTVTHTYESSGDYNVSLTIEDADGTTDTTTQNVSVQADHFVQEDGAGFGVVAAVIALLATVAAARRR